MEFRRKAEREKNYAHKRHRSRSLSPSRRNKSRKDDLRERKVEDYKYELRTFLEEQANISNFEDFWKFYDKYVAIQAVKKSDLDRNKLLNVDFMDKPRLLYDRLPVMDKKGEKIQIKYTQFTEFLTTIRVYQDFQQKTNFSKLKKLKMAQNELPIAQYKQEIIEKLKTNRVMVIAGK